jgi:hypothetical protein
MRATPSPSYDLKKLLLAISSEMWTNLWSTLFPNTAYAGFGIPEVPKQ